MKVDLTLAIQFNQPLCLKAWEEGHPAPLRGDKRGVYLIFHGRPPVSIDIDDPAENLIYIGKAVRETVSSRCLKHYWSVTDSRAANGNARTKPGRRMKAFRELIEHDAGKLWVVAGVMDPAHPYLMSCAEELLIHRYTLRHRRLPLANTAGGLLLEPLDEAEDRGASIEPQEGEPAMYLQLLEQRLCDDAAAFGMLKGIIAALERAEEELGAKVYCTDTSGGDIRVAFPTRSGKPRVAMLIVWQARLKRFRCATFPVAPPVVDGKLVPLVDASHPRLSKVLLLSIDRLSEVSTLLAALDKVLAAAATHCAEI